MQFKGVLGLGLMLLLSVSVAGDQDGSASGGRVKSCPPQCFCHRTGIPYEIVINCSSLALRAVPEPLPRTGGIVFLLLSNNNITTLAPNSFQGCENIKLLDLSNNSIQLGNFSADVSGLTKVTRLDLSQNQIDTLPKNMFANQNLQELDLSHNKLGRQLSEDGDVFSNLTGLKHLFLGHNHLTNINFSHVSSLTLLDLSHNEIHTLAENMFVKQETLQSLFLRHNHLTNINFLHVSTLTELDLSHNEIHTLAENMFAKQETLQTLSLGHNHLTNINFSHVSNLTELTILDLSHNEIHTLAENMFARQEKLRSLYLGHNHLTNINFSHVGNLTELISLDLSHNEIHTLAENVFIRQQILAYLNLSSNHLTNINFRLNDMIWLVWLDLANNHLIQIYAGPRQVMTNLVTLCGRETFTMDLSNNPLEISCNTLPFLEWVLSKSPGVLLANWRSYKSMYKGEHVKFSNLQDDILPELRAECVGKEVPIVAGILLAISVVVVVLAVVLFRHRFEVQYLCLKMIISRKQYQALEQQQQEADAYFEYDAFVAFDQNDLPFVKEKLQPTLEGDGGFRLCIHQRDFASGPIEENILKALHNSRNTILLLSKHFVNSSWCRYELQMARLRCFDEGRDLIIPVVLDDLPVRKLNRTLRGLLKKNTYIEWPESQNQQDIDNFWRKMRRSLQLQPDRVVRCQCGRTMNQTDLV